MAEKYFGEGTKKLGFGLMRLPKIGDDIDVDTTSKMVDMFLENGFTYFDTAFVYTGSEEATKKALVDRHDRSTYTLATKLHAGMVKSKEEARKELDVSLDRTGAGYIDYYLLHALMDDGYKKYEEYDLWNFVKEEKAKGRIKHYGFSFHGTPKLLDKLLTEHPDVEFVQLQINYADWENPEVKSRECYEVARSHGKSIVVMEPVKGGKLANPPKEVRKILKSIDDKASYASLAIRFVASLDGIITVLSGMSTPEQMADNVSIMKDFKPLTDDEMAVMKKAGEIFNKSKAIACTSCGYCMRGCPMNIKIPRVFEARNIRVVEGDRERADEKMFEATNGFGNPKDCIECRQCESVCPQHLNIVDLLKECV